MATPFPKLRWIALLWLAVWIPLYWFYWGEETFLQVCDLALVLGCLGIVSGNALLISTQAMATPVIGVVWGIDVAFRLLLGRHLLGGTEYMWDAHVPLWVRLLSLFHVLLPFLLIWALGRTGYDRRAWWIEAVIVAGLLVASRFIAPERNLNFAFRDPLLHRSLGPAPVHVMIILLGQALLVYAPAHLALERIFPPPKAAQG